jgi:AraC family transcriptional regulator
LQVNREYRFPEIVVVNAGHTNILPRSSYPPLSHPSHHYFDFYHGHLMSSLFEVVQSGTIGSEYLLSGMVTHILGHILTLVQRQKLSIGNRADEIIVMAKSIMESQFSSKVKLEEIASRLKISYAWFRKYFRKHTGFSPYDYLLNIRINHAKLLLKNSGRPVKEISMDSGFESQQQFSRTFKKRTGYTPKQFRSEKAVRSR